ncbi:hypothetical protein [Streptomyces rimosus]|uniref:hypothetical protein n=1 Tax=Streptomyces rimosus TaxID=1927 RepID=UPI0004C5EE96|nr:hypothetical protein [Streptomyces rimosus]
MNTAIPATAESAPAGQSPAQRAFRTAKMCVGVYGALSAAVLLTVVVLAATGHEVTSFMWGRSAGVLASAAVTYWLTVLAARGARWAYLRVRVISVVMPVVIVAIDLIPGALPAWFIAMQAVCALAIGATAFIVNGSELRAAFPKGR